MQITIRFSQSEKTKCFYHWVNANANANFEMNVSWAKTATGADKTTQQLLYIYTYTVNSTFFLFRRKLLSSGRLQSIWAWLTDTSRFTVYWFSEGESQICQFRKESDNKSFHLNRIILLLGILSRGKESFNKSGVCQTYMTEFELLSLHRGAIK